MNVVDAYKEKWETDLRDVYQRHGVFVAPTESVYGLSCDARDTEAVEKIFNLKRRSYQKPMIVLADSLEMVTEYCDLTHEMMHWLEEYWPGALTVIVSARSQMFSHRVVAEGPNGATVAIRVSSHPVIQACIKINGAPIVSTSANFSGDPVISHAYEVEHLLNTMKEKPDLFIHAGDLPSALPSTIVDCTVFPWRIVRNGSCVPILPL